MTENEAIERLQTLNIILTNKAGHEEDGFEKIFTFSDITAICTAIQALEEIQQLRAIGTIEEFKALKEKNEQIPIIHGKAELELHDKEIRNKDIDEFTERLKANYQSHAIDMCLRQNDYYSYSNACHTLEIYIDEIAEEMKGGAE